MHQDSDRVRQFLANMPLTMEGHEVRSFRDVDTEDPKLARVFKQRRLEAILKAVCPGGSNLPGHDGAGHAPYARNTPVIYDRCTPRWRMLQVTNP